MLIVGCGGVGRKVAARLVVQGTVIHGLVRSTDGAAMVTQSGAIPLLIDLDHDQLAPLPTVGAEVFYFAPPPSGGRRDTRMAHFLDACARYGHPARIVAISTTGVYGDCGGDWVDESWPVNPQTDRAQRRWDAEQQLQAWRRDSGGELVILRVAGIYGPDRLPLDRLRRNTPMVAAAEAPWTNRVHIDDLVEVCLAAMRRGGAGAVYNVSDGHPGNMADYFNQVADRAGLPRPPAIRLEDAENRLSPGLISYLGESRRLRNTRMLAELGIKLRYPTLNKGLDQCFAAAP